MINKKLRNLCRFCMTKFANPTRMTDKLSNSMTLADMITVFPQIQGFQVSNETLPNYSCHKCCEAITTSYNFHQQCLKTFEKFKKHFSAKPNRKKGLKNPPEKPRTKKLTTNSFIHCCDKTFGNETAYRRHIKLVHFRTAPPIICRICSRKFNTHKALALHRNKHRSHSTEGSSHKKNQYTRQTNICCYCKKGFLNGFSRKLHNTQVHSQPKSLVCAHCKELYTSKQLLLNHYRKLHSDKKNLFRCGVCPDGNDVEYSFDSLKSHMDAEHVTVSRINDKNKQMGKNIKSIDNLEVDSNEELVKKSEDHEEILKNATDVTNCEQMIEEFLDEAADFLTALDGKDEQSNIPDSLSDIGDKPHDLLYACPKCTDQFSAQNDLIVHLAHIHKDLVLVCNQCGWSFNEHSLLVQHRREHERDNQLLSMITSTIDQRSADEIEVIQDGDEIVYVCKLCNLKFTRQSNVEQHDCKFYKKSEDNTIQFQCTNCTETFPSLNAMYKHRKLHKTDGFFCSLCDKKFLSIGGLKYHLKTHNGIKSFECPFCKRKFTAKTNLNAHLRTMHTNFKSIPCTECDRRFTTTDHLRKHTQSVHRATGGRDGSRKYVCGECGKGYLQRSHLVHHTWTHTGVKQHRCDWCVKSYTSRNSLKKHMMKVHLFNNF